MVHIVRVESCHPDESPFCTAKRTFFLFNKFYNTVTVYIIYSETTLKYYTGQTDNLENRLHRHNSGLSLSTKSGRPWTLIYQIQFPTRSEAMSLEGKIKKRGAKRYLEDIGFI